MKVSDVNEAYDELAFEPHEEELLSRVAWHYYHDGLTQSEIGERLNLSRIKVSRMLDRGRRMGLIHVHIQFKLRRLLRARGPFAGDLRPRRGARHPRPGDRQHQRPPRRGGLDILMGRLKDQEMLAVGWGATVMGTLQRLARTLSYRDISLVSLTGGVSAYIEGVASGRSSHNVHLIPAPLVVSQESIAEAIRAERHVVEVMSMARTANYALVGIGAVADKATLIASGYASRSQFEIFRRQGAVGDIIGIFYDQNGAPLDLSFHKMLVGLDFEALSAIPQVIAAAGGPKKVEAIRAAARGGRIDVLITDEPTAEAILEKDQHDRPTFSPSTPAPAAAAPSSSTSPAGRWPSPRRWTHLSDPRYPGSMEFDCAANWALLCRCVRKALADAGLPASAIRAVSATSMREGIVLWDRDGRELWACANVDSRASDETRR